ncbi:MAG TPA: hypothetical protein VGP16_18980 [Asanoa sp.]|nr:hypothetical protein [Asanoa sp.]
MVGAVLIALLAGCGDSEVRQPGAVPWTPAASPSPGPDDWPDRVAADRDSGALFAPGFNELVDSAAPEWAASLDTAAAQLLGLNGPFDGPVEIYLRQESGPVVTATLTRLGDDSVHAIRYRVVFTRGDDGRYRFVSGERTMSCQSGRGHRTFKTDRCS